MSETLAVFLNYKQSLHINLCLSGALSKSNPTVGVLHRAFTFITIVKNNEIIWIHIESRESPEMKLIYFKKKLSTKTLNYICVAYCLSCSNHFGDVNDLTVSFWQFIWHFFWDLQSGTIKLLPLHEIPSGTEIAMGAMFCLSWQTEKRTKKVIG